MAGHKSVKLLQAWGAFLALAVWSHDAAAITSRQLIEVVDISGPVMSPDGSAVAFRTEQASVERNTYDTFWYIQRLDADSPAMRISDGGLPLRDSAGVPLATDAVWSPDGLWIYYRALIDGRVDVWRAAVDGSGAEPLTADPGNVRKFTISDDGRKLIYSVGATRERIMAAEQAEHDRGIRVDERVPIGQPLYRSGFVEGRWATQRYTGVGFDKVGLLAEEPDLWKVVDLRDGSKRAAQRPEVPEPVISVADIMSEPLEPWKESADPSSERIAVLMRARGSSGLLYEPHAKLEVLVRSGERAECLAAACTNREISRVQWRSGTDEVLFTITRGEMGRSQSVFGWNTKSGAVRRVVAFEGQASGSRDPDSPCAVSIEAMVCVVAESTGPPRLERIDLDTGDRAVLFDPNNALAHQIARSLKVELIRWTDTDGQVFTGQYFRPRNESTSPTPLFITYYSCSGFIRGGTGDEWPLAELAQHGISALCINYAPLRTDVVERYDQALSGIESAIELLASRGHVERSKVGMGGLSLASSITMWVAMKSDLIAAASVASGIVSPTYYLWGSMKGEDFKSGLEAYWKLQQPDKTPEQWRALSPAFNVHNIHAPILFQMPEQEYLLALDYAIPLIQAGRADLYVFPNEPHQKFQPRHKLAANLRNVDWFRFWLQGYEDPAEEKEGVYTHWRKMRSALPRRGQ